MNRYRAIVNLTQHDATPEQIAEGVFDLPEAERKILARLLTFNDPPSDALMQERALAISDMVGEKICTAMIGGAPFFMSTLEKVLLRNGIEYTYSFSKRESIEENDGRGAVTKRSIFRHVGWV